MITSVYLKQLEESTMKSAPWPLTGGIGPSKIWLEERTEYAADPLRQNFAYITVVIYEYQVSAIHRWFEIQHWYLVNEDVYYEPKTECLSKSI